MSVCTQSTQFTSPTQSSEYQRPRGDLRQRSKQPITRHIIQSSSHPIWRKCGVNHKNTLGLSFLDGKVQLKVGWIRAWNIWCDDDRQNYALFRPNKSSHLEDSSKKSCFMISWKGFFQSNWCMEQEHLEPLKVVIVLNRLAFYLNFPHALLY